MMNRRLLGFTILACLLTFRAGSAETPGPMALRYDGRLTGPGTISYEAHNRAADETPLSIVGIVFGNDRRGGAIKILKSTPVQTVIPSKPSHFTLKVSQAEFDGWKKRYEPLTVAISFPSEKDRDKWEYINLLTKEDADRQLPGEFRVMGAFKLH